MKYISNILVTTDFSGDSDWAIEEAALLARRFNSNLYMLDVVDTINDTSVDYVIPYEVLESEKKRMMEKAYTRVMAKVDEMEKRFQIKAIGEVRYGDVHDEILKEELEKHIDLVVIAPHEKRGVTGRLFSHLSDRIARDSKCDTLLVRKGIPVEEGHVFV